MAQEQRDCFAMQHWPCSLLFNIPGNSIQAVRAFPCEQDPITLFRLLTSAVIWRGSQNLNTSSDNNMVCNQRLFSKLKEITEIPALNNNNNNNNVKVQNKCGVMYRFQALYTSQMQTTWSKQLWVTFRVRDLGRRACSPFHWLVCKIWQERLN